MLNKLKTKITALILLLFILKGCTPNKPENLPSILDLTFPTLNKNAISKNETRKTIIYFQDSLDNKQELGYDLYDPLGNLIYKYVSMERTRLKYDSSGFLIKKEFITDYIASFSIKYDFFPKERKLHQIWFNTRLTLKEIDTSEMPPSDTTILIFSSKNLLLSEKGYLHEDKEVKSIGYEKEYQYDSLNRVTKITTLYFNLNEDFRYMAVSHNPTETLMLSPYPKIEETFKYQGKDILITEKESLYTDLKMKKDSFIRKTLYDSRGLTKEILNQENNSSIQFFHAPSGTIKLEHLK